MFDHTASTRQPPAGGPGNAAHLDGLLQELRRGERDGFLRYFRLFRSPVYDFALRLVGDEAAAVAATTEAFIVAFRQVIIDEAETDLQVLTWRCALDACGKQAGSPVSAGTRTDPARAYETPRAHRLHGPSGPGPRFEAALEALDLRHRAALLLHDVHGLSVAETAAVFAVGEEAAGTLLFRAREQFRQTFDERSADLRGGSCRLAERAVAGAVGLGLGADEIRRLRRHAGYCRPCRAMLKSWGQVPAGLAVFLEKASLPRALSTPIFAGAAESARMTASARASVLGRSLGRVGRVLRSRTAAYVVAAACLALAAGAVVREEGVRQFIYLQSAGPTIRLVTQPSADDRRPARNDGRAASSRRPSSEPQATISGVTSSQPLPAASPSKAPPPSDSDAAADSGVGGSTATTETGSPQVPAVNASPAAGRVAAAAKAADKAAKAAGKAAAKSRQQATKDKAHRAGSQGRGRAAGSDRVKAAGHDRAKEAGRARPAGATHSAPAGGGHAPEGDASGSHGSSDKSKKDH